MLTENGQAAADVFVPFAGLGMAIVVGWAAVEHWGWRDGLALTFAGMFVLRAMAARSGGADG